MVRGPSLLFHLCRGGIRETGESSEKGDRLEADGFTDAQERVEEVGVRDTTLPF